MRKETIKEIIKVCRESKKNYHCYFIKENSEIIGCIHKTYQSELEMLFKNILPEKFYEMNFSNNKVYVIVETNKPK